MLCRPHAPELALQTNAGGPDLGYADPVIPTKKQALKDALRLQAQMRRRAWWN